MGIKFANVDRPAKIVLVTSALPAEGKSIIASNLAQQAAMAGERVMLIDMDLPPSGDDRSLRFGCPAGHLLKSSPKVSISTKF